MEVYVRQLLTHKPDYVTVKAHLIIVFYYLAQYVLGLIVHQK